MGEEEWRKYTPAIIDRSLCLARTWNNGAGGQCGKKAAPGSLFCTGHAEKWEVHGRVDGPIPEKKLNEFQRKGIRGGAVGGAAAAPKAAAPKPAAAKAAAAPKAGAAQKRPRESSAPPPAAAKIKASPAASASAVASGSSSGKATTREPPPKKATTLKCTCGCPIHTERCKLFRPSTAFTTTTATSYNPRLGKPEPPQPPRFAPRPETSGTPFKVAPPVAFVHDWAREQVAKIAKEVKSHKAAERKTMYRKLLLEYHPDKRLTSGSRAEGRSDSELNEVVMDLKRRIDMVGA